MKLKVPITLKKSHSLSVIFDEPMVLQSSYYTYGLQNLILSKNNLSYILVDSAHSVVYGQLIKLYEYNNANTFEDKLIVAASLYKILGFGLLDFSLKDEGIVTSPYSYYSLSSVNKAIHSVLCYFTCGFIEAVMSSAKEEPIGSYSVVEKECSRASDGKCTFKITRLFSPRSIVKSPCLGSLYNLPITRTIHNQIGEEDIVNSITKLNISGDQKGLISYFGIYLTRHYANYYNLVSNLFIKELKGSTSGMGSLFYNWASESSYYTFGSIMQSEEWRGIVQPFITRTEDIVHGVIAWINSLGWGMWNIKELVAGEGAVINIFGSYESNGYIGLFGKTASECSCYSAVGTLAGIMNLVYLSDFPLSLKPSYKADVLNSEYSFEAEETRCRSRGDSICEIVVTRR